MDLRGMRQQGSGDDYITRIFVLYFSPNINRVIKSRILRWAGCVACVGARRGAYWVLVERLEVRRPLGRPTPRWQNNIKMDPQEVEKRGMDYIDLAEARDRLRAVVNAVLNLRIP